MAKNDTALFLGKSLWSCRFGSFLWGDTIYCVHFSHYGVISNILLMSWLKDFVNSLSCSMHKGKNFTTGLENCWDQPAWDFLKMHDLRKYSTIKVFLLLMSCKTIRWQGFVGHTGILVINLYSDTHIAKMWSPGKMSQAKTSRVLDSPL